MQRLVQGIEKFQSEVFPQQQQFFEDLAKGQKPETLFITCADSRVVPGLFTQTNPGELFICRNAGNMVPVWGDLQGGVSATIEYAVAALKVRHVIVCGHTDCGVMKGIMNPTAVAHMPTVQSWLNQGEVARRVVFENRPEATDEEKMHLLTEENVVAQLDHLRTHPSVASAIARGELLIHGWIFGIADGSVRAWDGEKQEFVPVSEYNTSSATPRRRAMYSKAGEAA